jgi:hypothetical protein
MVTIPFVRAQTAAAPLFDVQSPRRFWRDAPIAEFMHGDGRAADSYDDSWAATATPRALLSSLLPPDLKEPRGAVVAE